MNTFKVPPNRRFVRKSRPLDFIYDPVYFIPSKVDFYKTALDATKFGDSKLKLQPNYPAMFSDIRTDVRVKACLKPNEPDYMKKFLQDYDISGVPVYPMECGPPYNQQDDVVGADRAKYFIKYVPAVGNMGNYHLTRDIKNLKTIPAKSTDVVTLKSRGTQTDFREIETQTDPYSPPFSLPHPDDYPKVLALIKMTWGKGLPATLDDIVNIERALTRRLIEMNDRMPNKREDFVQRVRLMEKLEAQQWQDREKELEKIRALKWEVVSRQLTEMKSRMARDQTSRLEKIFLKKKHENNEKLNKIKLQYLRQLRKLERKYRQGKRTFKRDIILDYIDMESFIYAPLARNGLNVDQLGSVPDYQFTVHRDYETLSYLTDMDSFVAKHLTFDMNDFSKRIKKLKPNRRTQMLEKELGECFEAFRDICKPKEKSGDDEMLNSMIMKSVRRLSTPEEELVCDEDEDDEESIVILQTLIRGRAVQSLLRQEAQNNMETVLQLKAAYETDPFGSLQPIGEKIALRQQQQEQDAAVSQGDDMKELLEQVEGEVLSHMMNFLEKEMTRLLDERKIHSLILLAERERRMLEASEAGTRQKEEDCMRANDEIWRQVIGIHQQTVDMYLEDIYLESINRTADEGARKHVQQLAKTVNDAAYLLEKNIKDQDKDEIAADLVHSFLFPQVKRENMQRQMVDLHGRYYSVATQITNAVLNSKGMVQEVLDIIGPELTKRFQEGADIVGASYCAVEQIIASAVELVLQKEKAKMDSVAADSENDGEEKDKPTRSHGNEDLSRKQSVITVVSRETRKSVVKSESEKTLSEQYNEAMDMKVKSISESELLGERRTSAEDKSNQSQGILPAKSESHQKKDKEVEVKPGHEKGSIKSLTDTATGSSSVSVEESQQEITDKATNFDSAEEEEEDEAKEKMVVYDKSDPWKIPIPIPQEFCDIIGIKAMEVENAASEMTETAAKTFDAACVTVNEIFQELQECFTQSEEESDKELDDDDPDQD
ncbi:unnamed protein product [Allacma fusca]|uniref:Cilia- and flagella-associated protein 91 n=1 Tax=Allacma fusca TaxID=39272 RepID=A0A8J2P9D7_9HEXA|nr:unnamed protein product [Allacma fusca]